MAQQLPQIVQSAKGKQYDVNSPQGKMIVNAAKPAFDSDSKILSTISTNVISIGESVTAMLMIAQADARGDALNSANVPQDDLTGGDILDPGDIDGGSGGGGSSSGGGGFFSKLFGGAGGVMAGGGLLLGGFGALMAGGGVLLKEFNNFDGEKFKKNIESIMSIVPSITSPGAAAAFAVDTGMFVITMGALGAGIALFGIGSSIGGLGSGLANFINPDWAQSIKDNVTTLLSISDIFGEGFAGKAAFIGESALFGASMFAIGSGLAIFGLGSAVAGIGDGLNQGINHFTTKGWAQSIVDNVKTLLGISKLFTGLGNAFVEGGKFIVAMTMIGAGLALFGGGSVVAGAADAVTSGIDKFGEVGWAQSIVDNVTTLLGISNLFTGIGDAFVEGGKFITAMTMITGGLLLFSFGSAVAGATTDILDVTDWAARGEGMSWSQSIVDHVTNLLSIASLPNVGADTTAFAGTMAGITAGLVAFGVGSFFASGTDSLAQFISTSQEGEGSWADKIKDKVTTLLSIVSGDTTLADANNFHAIMTKLSLGLTVFSGATFVSKLLDVGSKVLSFLTGAESPVKEMLNIADSADELERGANAIESLTSSLSKISLLKFDGSKINMKAFAEDLAQSVPAIETAIMGGTLNKGILNLKKNIDIKGLASADIDFTTAIHNIRALRSSLGVELTPVGAGSTQQLQNATSTMMTSDGPRRIVIAPSDNSTTSIKQGDTYTGDLEAYNKSAWTDDFMAQQKTQ